MNHWVRCIRPSLPLNLLRHFAAGLGDISRIPRISWRLYISRVSLINISTVPCLLRWHRSQISRVLCHESAGITWILTDVSWIALVKMRRFATSLSLFPSHLGIELFACSVDGGILVVSHCLCVDYDVSTINWLSVTKRPAWWPIPRGPVESLLSSLWWWTTLLW